MTGRLFGWSAVPGAARFRNRNRRSGRVAIVSAVKVGYLVRSGGSGSGLAPAAVCFAAKLSSVCAFRREDLWIAGPGSRLQVCGFVAWMPRRLR